MSTRVRERDGLRIRRSQVRVLPSALSLFFHLQGKLGPALSHLRRPARSIPQLVPQRSSGGLREHPAEAAANGPPLETQVLWRVTA